MNISVLLRTVFIGPFTNLLASHFPSLYEFWLVLSEYAFSLHVVLKFTKQLFLQTPFLRGSAQPAFTCSNSIELTSTMYKVDNKNTE